MAYLVRADYTGDMQGYLIGIINAAPHLQDGLVAAIADVTALSGLDKGYIDVAFFKSTDAMAARLAQSGLRFDFPKPDAQTAHPAPGMDPDRPPILR